MKDISLSWSSNSNEIQQFSNSTNIMAGSSSSSSTSTKPQDTSNYYTAGLAEAASKPGASARVQNMLDSMQPPIERSESDRMLKFDIGFYDRVQQEMQNKTQFYFCMDRLGDIPSDSIPSMSANPQNLTFVDISETIHYNPHCKSHLITYQNMTIAQLQDDADYHTVVILLEPDDSPDPNLQLLKHSSRAEMHKLKIASQIEKLGAKNIYKAQTLSFVSADIPVESITRLSDYDYSFLIGDGETILYPALDNSKDVIKSEGLSFTGTGITVTVIDMGIKQEHSDLFPIPVSRQLVCADKICAPATWPNNYGDSLAGIDNTGHGTPVAGIIAGSGYYDSSKKGVAPDAKIINLKISTYCGTVFDPFKECAELMRIITAIDWSVTNSVRVINLSVGNINFDVFSNYTVESLVVDEAVDHGVNVISAAGNSGKFVTHSIIPPGTSYNGITG